MKTNNTITESDVTAFLLSKLTDKIKGVQPDYISFSVHVNPDTGEYSFSSVFMQAVDHIERKCGNASTVVDAHKALHDALVCDHDWKTEDQSFDHEFGTERVVFDQCQNCDETRENNPHEAEDITCDDREGK